MSLSHAGHTPLSDMLGLVCKQSTLHRACTMGTAQPDMALPLCERACHAGAQQALWSLGLDTWPCNAVRDSLGSLLSVSCWWAVLCHQCGLSWACMHLHASLSQAHVIICCVSSVQGHWAVEAEAVRDASPAQQPAAGATALRTLPMVRPCYLSPQLRLSTCVCRQHATSRAQQCCASQASCLSMPLLLSTCRPSRASG